MPSGTARIGRALLGAALVWSVTAWEGQAAETNVVIQGFEYRPGAVQVDAGDTVAWTNLDGTVHSVTAPDGSFDSGRLGQGQRYVLAFNQPGEYAYFCTLHDHEGTVVVGGTGPTTTTGPETPATTDAPTTTATATGAAGAAPPSAGALTTGAPPPLAGVPASTTPFAVGLAAASPPPNPATPAAEAATGSASKVAVVSAPDALAELPLAPVAVLASVLALVGAIALQLSVPSRPGAARQLLAFAAVLTALAGAIHVQLDLAVGYPEPVSSMFLAHGLVSVLVAGSLVARPGRRAVGLAVALQATSLAAFVMSRTVGLFGFREAGWDPSPQAAVAVACELAALGVLALAARADSPRTRSLRPAGADLRFR